MYTFSTIYSHFYDLLLRISPKFIEKQKNIKGIEIQNQVFESGLLHENQISCIGPTLIGIRLTGGLDKTLVAGQFVRVPHH